MLCEANASFNSTNPISSIFNPALCNAFCVAGTGPTPIIAGSTPADAIETIFANGVKEYSFTAFSLANNKEAAPSFIPDEFPAVTVPSFLNAGFNTASLSKEVFLGCSSTITQLINPLLCISTAAISLLNLPASFATKYFSCD